MRTTTFLFILTIAWSRTSMATVSQTVDYVIHVSVDGLRPDAITTLGPSEVPNFYRLRNEGVYTDSARTDPNVTMTMPNHVSMLTGRGQLGAAGHNVTRNSDPGSPVGGLGSVGISTNAGEFVRGSGALRIDAGNMANHVVVNGNLITGPPNGNTITVAAWFKLTDLGSDGSDTRNALWETGPASFCLSFGVRSDTVGSQKHTQWFTQSPQASGVAGNLPAVGDGLWHHAVVVTDEAADLVTYYFDGVWVETVSVPGLVFPQTGAEQFFIGSHRAGDGSRNWDGFIDDMVVFDHAISSNQVADLFAGTLDVLSVTGGSTVAYWPFDTDYASTTNNDLYAGTAVAGFEASVHTDSLTAGGDAYVRSVFDVVHDHGLNTALYAGWNGFNFLDWSWNGVNGAADTTGGDDGTDKIDTYVLVTDDDLAAQTTTFLANMAASPHNYSLIHWHRTDARGHAASWMSTDYLDAVKESDVQLGRLLDFVETNTVLQGKTAIILTADHGGFGFGHSAVREEVYAIPFYVWGAGVAQGRELYAINLNSRTDPGSARPDYAATPQPIRNGDAANLALELLGFSAVSGSTINVSQDLNVAATEGRGVIQVYLMGGQSNMQGVGRKAKLTSGLSEIPNVQLYHSDNTVSTGGANTLMTVRPAGFDSASFGPEIGFADIMNRYVSTNALALVKHAYGGSSIEIDWKPGTNNADVANWGPHYAKFVDTINLALATFVANDYQPRIHGMIWHQGEQDAKDGLNAPESDTSADDYGKNLTNLIVRVREQFSAYAGNDGIRFVHAQVLPYAPAGGDVLARFPGRDPVRTQQLEVDEDSGSALALTNTACLPVNSPHYLVHEQVVDGYRDDDEVHFTAEAQLAMGRAMAYEMLRLPQPVGRGAAVRAARIQVTGTDNASTTYSVLNETPLFDIGFANNNFGDHELYSGLGRLQQSQGVIIASANDGEDSIVQVAGDLTYEGSPDPRYDNGMGFSTVDLSNGGEKNFNFAFAHFPFVLGWRAAHVDSGGTISAGPYLPEGTTVTNLNTTPAWRGPGHYGVHIPGADSRTNGMLFVVGGENDNNYIAAGVFEHADDVNVVSGEAALGDWHVQVRNASHNDTSNVGEDGSFSFLYLAYDTFNLVGGRIGAGGAVLNGTDNFSVTNISGKVAIKIPDGRGGHFSDADGVPILTGCGIFDDINSGANQDPVNGDVFSWQYDEGEQAFVVSAFDPPSGGAGGGAFVFAFVPFENSLKIQLDPSGMLLLIR